ncbi:MAG: selenide, water dikinase SelD [Planctomycetia bacterium]|nr:selenide, water dikinase SelD [Planctomycetia bacterium]
MNSTLPQHDIVLLGAGHTNAHVLRMWRMTPRADSRLTLVSDFSLATYSGMLPGTLAGLYPPERMQIDLVRLCAAAGARFIRADVTGLDLNRRELLLLGRPPVPFDVLSIGIGSVPKLPAGIDCSSWALTIKPMQTFLARLDERLMKLCEAVVDRPWRIAIVGSGAGGLEIAFCLPPHLARLYPGSRFQLMVVDSNRGILAGADPGMVRRARRELESRRVELVLGREVVNLHDGRMGLSNGDEMNVDLAIWATSAAAPPILANLGLPTDDRGFLLTRATLQTVADAPVFVVGDSGTNVDSPAPKAGVYAVRQGPILWENLRRQLDGQRLLPYAAQKGFLKLLGTGDRRAILAYKGQSFHAAWCWKLKNRIDSQFMDKFQDYTPRPMQTGIGEAAGEMRCTGCGGKVGGAVLARVLDRLGVPPEEHVVLGLNHPDDAAIVRVPKNGPVAATVDFFAPFLDDPYLVGRVAALNSASDVFALGAVPLAALAIAAVEPGPARQQEQLLFELLAGALAEFRAMGAALVGGHTIENPQTLIGFSVLAGAPDRPWLKAGLKPGDRLVLTKPLGTGILLAAHRRALCRHEWFEALEQTMLASNQTAARCAVDLDLRAVTDVTGFGLAGHLLEMLQASGASAELPLNCVPLLSGVEELVALGIESTLAPANRGAETQIEVSDALRKWPQYAALFDPQTSGGLLLGVPRQLVDECLLRLRSASQTASVVGEVTAASAGKPLRIV